MRGGIGEYPEIRRENEAGIKEVAARPDLNVMKRGKGVSITPGHGGVPSVAGGPGRRKKLKSMAGAFAKCRLDRYAPCA